MTSKYLEKKIDLLTKDNEIEFLNPVQLEYYLLESEEKQRGDLSGQKVYGIEVVKNNGKGFFESDMIRNIYSSRESTKSILHKLAENTVTPVSLRDVLDDIIGI